MFRKDLLDRLHVRDGTDQHGLPVHRKHRARHHAHHDDLFDIGAVDHLRLHAELRSGALYILVGIGVGATIHGYVPSDFFESILVRMGVFAVPVAVLLAVPLYSNAAGVLPIVQSLIAKGVPLGTGLAFMMGVVGLSLPEALILKKVLKLPLLLTFFGTVTAGIMLIGYLFNFLLA